MQTFLSPSFYSDCYLFSLVVTHSNNEAEKTKTTYNCTVHEIKVPSSVQYCTPTDFSPILVIEILNTEYRHTSFTI